MINKFYETNTRLGIILDKTPFKVNFSYYSKLIEKTIMNGSVRMNVVFGELRTVKRNIKL